MIKTSENWAIKEFGDIVSIKCSKFDPKSQNERRKCIELEHIEQQSGRIVGYSNTFESTSTKNVFSKGDVLFGKLRPYLRKFAQAPFDGVCSSEIWVFTPQKSIRNDFLYYLIQSDSFLDQANKSCGTKMPRADWKVVSKYNFLLPPLVEQQKIAEVLSTVDKKINLIAQKIAETEKLKTGLMQKLFSEGVGVQDENGEWQPHSEFKESMYGSIPLCWEVSTFKKLLKSKDVLGIQDGNHGESHPVSSDFVSEGVPFITANKISSRNKLLTKSAKKISHEQYKSLRIGFSKPGDVILTHKGTVGLTAIVSEEDGELMMSPQTTYYRLGENSCLINSFLYYFFQTSGFKRVLNQKSQQSTRAYIGITKQAELSVLIPELKEQKQISSILNAVDSKLDLLTEQKIEIKKLKKGLMQKLLTGEWRVPVEETEAA